ncbi:MAG: ATP-binding protein [Oscillospiraceae bacterium]|jgi:DNA replication protein DnaC|nr:ATP-binding protein [Oscillospiraceae bacterium]
MYGKAAEIIAKRRHAAKFEYNKRYDEILEKIPEFGEINHKLASTAYKLLGLPKDDFQRQFEKIRDENIQAQDLSTDLLIEHGYPADYLDMKYTCEKCSDTGIADGKHCECMLELVRQLSAKALNDRSHVRLTDFSQFQLHYYKDPAARENNAKILQYCQNYAENFTPSSKGILMIGQTGLGKTLLSLAIAKAVSEKGFNVLYDSASNYLRRIEKEHFGRITDTDTLETLLEADLIILDDLGAEFSTSFYVSAVYNIINTRLNREKPTIISTNLTPRELEKIYDSKIISRLLSFGYLKFMGEDVRAALRVNGQ